MCFGNKIVGIFQLNLWSLEHSLDRLETTAHYKLPCFRAIIAGKSVEISSFGLKCSSNISLVSLYSKATLLERPDQKLSTQSETTQKVFSSD